MSSMVADLGGTHSHLNPNLTINHLGNNDYEEKVYE